MGDITVQNFIDEITASFGNRTDIDNTRIIRALNFSQKRIARVHDWEELQIVTTGTLPFTGSAAADKLINRPANLRKIYSFRLTHPTDTNIARKITYIPYRVWDRRVPAPEAFARGKPDIYTMWREKIEIWPVGDAAHAYEIRHSNFPAAFTTGGLSALSDLDNKDDLIQTLTMSYLYLTLRQPAMANTYFATYKEMVDSASLTESEKPDSAQGSDEVRGGVPNDYWVDPFVRQV